MLFSCVRGRFAGHWTVLCVKRKLTCSGRLFWQYWHAARSLFSSIGRRPVRQGQCERCCRTLLGGAGEGEPATVSNRDVPGDGESESCSSRLARTGLVHPVKALAQVRQMFGCNADTGVMYLQERSFILHRCAHCDAPSRSIVFDGVVEQYQYCLFQQQRIPNYVRIVGILYLDSDAALFGQGLYPSCSLLSQLSQAHHFVFLVESAVVQAGKCQ